MASPPGLPPSGTAMEEPKSLRGVGMLDMLELDPRPAIIFDACDINRLSQQDALLPLYWNTPMTAVDSGDLLRSLTGQADPQIANAVAQFRRWITNADASKTSFSYYGYSWTNILVSSRWILISGTRNKAARPSESAAPEAATHTRRISTMKASTFDWTDELPPVRLSPHIAWARSIDWSQTSLGPMSTWTSQLRSIANLVMQDPRPAVVFYGPDLIMVYNEAEIELLGGFHPCMGVSAHVALEAVWADYFEPMITINLAGETVQKTNTAIHMVRNGFMEETYFSLKFIPIFDSEGATVGHYQPLEETTRNVISQRRSQTLLELSEEIPRARNSELYWALATDVLSRNDKDVPFVLLYSAEAEGIGSSSSRARRSDDYQQKYTLRGSLGFAQESLTTSVHINLQQEHSFAPYFRQAMRKPIVVQLDQDPRAARIVREAEWRGFGDPCRALTVCPLNPTSSKDNVLGFMVMGLNPRRPYDDDYLQFIMLASRLLSTSLSSILLHEEDIGRRERTIANAEAMKLALKQQLHESQQKAERNISRFQRFAESSDIGIFIVDMNGVYAYRNDAWYDILDPNDSEIELEAAWEALIDDDYIQLGQDKFGKLVETKQHQSFELRLKKTWGAPRQDFGKSGFEQQPKWVLCSIFPDLSEHGEVLEIIGCITDISQQKWGETIQAAQASKAKEAKRQLENFIDTTSHEMRNPLSAIVQCADSIISSHRTFEKSVDYQSVYQEILSTTVDAADTIVQCSKHMKTIVDDVLTVSKLDSGLFVMTPIDVNPESVVRDAVKMFEGEARAAGVSLEYRPDDSYKQIGGLFVSLDPTRVLQILINLVTNAIKFTRLEKTRQIMVSLGIAYEPPLHNINGLVKFACTSSASEALTLQADWVEGENVYVIFSVQDTGRGLSPAEHDLLFARFSQASPRTHIDYGGSGLGLFISRRLTEMHGGAIGFASKAGVGSEFSFYVKSRKSRVPQRESGHNEAFDKEDKSPSPSAHSIEPDIPAKDLHILIVEDNLVNQRVLAKQLRNLGMQVAVANHGGEALQYLRSTNYCKSDGSGNNLSLILMDWEMPVMDGLTCVREIRELQRQGELSGHVPVVAVTANVRFEQVEVALKAGMDDVISKPFRVPELCVCIQRTLRIRSTVST